MAERSSLRAFAVYQDMRCQMDIIPKVWNRSIFAANVFVQKRHSGAPGAVIRFTDLVKLRVEHNIGRRIRRKLVHHVGLDFVGILQARIEVGPFGSRQTLTPEIDQVVVRKYSVVSRRPDIELLIGCSVAINKLDGSNAIDLRNKAKAIGERILLLAPRGLSFLNGPSGGRIQGFRHRGMAYLEESYLVKCRPCGCYNRKPYQA